LPTLAATATPGATPPPDPTLSAEARELLAFADAYTRVRSDHITRDGYRQRNPRWTPAPFNVSNVGIRASRTEDLLVAMDTEQELRRLSRTPLTRGFIEAALAAIETEMRASQKALDATYFPDNSRDQLDLLDQSNVLDREAERLWRGVADQIEDALRSRGLGWPRYRPG
jgi:hypothetical protein